MADLIARALAKTKADKTYVDSQITAVNASPKGVYATLSALQTAFPSGNNNIYLVTADGKWYFWNGSAWTAGGVYQSTGLAAGSVTPDITSFMIKSPKRNQIDESTKQTGYRGNTSIGGKVSDANYVLFEKFPIDPNTTYSVWCKNNNSATYNLIQARYINFYDQSGTYLGSGSSLSSWLSSFTSPANAYFADVSFNINASGFVLVPSAYVSQYLPYGSLEAVNLYVGLDKSTVVSTNVTLVTDSDFYSGYSLNVTNGTNFTDASYKASAFVPVTAGSSYVIDGLNAGDTSRTLEGAKHICFFDSSFTFIKTVSAASGASSVYIKSFDVPSGVAYIRFDTNLNTSSVALYKATNAGRKEAQGTNYLPTNIKINSDNLPPNFKIEIKKAEKNVIASIGDSLTAGTGGGGTTYSTVLESLTGIRTENYGIGGENVNTIAARQGGLVMLVNNITIPATAGTTVNIGTSAQGILCNNGKYAFPLLQGSGTFGGINNCLISGVLGQIQLVSGNYQFSRYDSGSTVTISRPTPIITNVASRKPYNKMVIWIGQNGGYDTTAEWISVIKQMINFSDVKDYIICGLTSGTAASRASEEKSFLDEFGRHYLNLRAYLTTPIYDGSNNIISSYGLSDASLTATAQDLTDIASGITPISLRMDPNDENNVHFNASGYTVIGTLIYKRGQELGYW